MDENKNNELLEEGVEEAVEAAEEVLEEAVEAVEDAVDEAVEEIAEGQEVEDSTEAEKYIDTMLLIDEVTELKIENEKLSRTNKALKGVLKAIVAIVIIAALAFGGMKAYKTFYNPYNHMGYYNISGMTLESVAEMNNMSVEQARRMLQLPDDVKGDTYYDVVQFLVPVSYMTEMYGMSVEEMKEAFSLGEEITAESTWGEALDTMPLKIYLGSEEAVSEFVAEYNLGDDVTADTLWGEVRKTVNKIDYERYLAESATDVTEAE
ncbi:MAG: hypothetical protein IJC69_05795 [Clostridia bacterium]|nr:hypothetical protein [Clostridia bacterium]